MLIRVLLSELGVVFLVLPEGVSLQYVSVPVMCCDLRFNSDHLVSRMSSYLHYELSLLEDMFLLPHSGVLHLTHRLLLLVTVQLQPGVSLYTVQMFLTL